MNTRTPLITSALLAASLFSVVAHAALPSYTFTALGVQGGRDSEGMAINASGQVAGYSVTTGSAITPAIVWNGTTATQLSTLGGPWSYAYAINASGQVAGNSFITPMVGGSYTSNEPTHAVVWNGTITTDLGTLGGTQSYAYAINASGQVAGKSYTAGNAATHAVVWNGTTATDLGTLGGTYSEASAINASGQVAGRASTTGNMAYHAVVWNGTAITDLGTLGGTYSNAAAINDLGQVVGTSNSHATVWNGTIATDLGTLGGTSSSARAINASGQIVGYSYTTGDAATHAVVWNGTTAIDLNSFLDASTVSAGWVLNYARGINDNGWIVGEASNSLLGIGSQAFLLSVSSVPEPEAYGMMFVGLGMLGFMARRRKNDQA